MKECEKRGVEIVFRKEFVRLEENDGEVRVFFKDGDVIGTDLVIGADGFRSRVRGFIEPEAKATYVGTMNIYGTIPAETLDARWRRMERGYRCRACCLGRMEASPLGDAILLHEKSDSLRTSCFRTEVGRNGRKSNAIRKI